MNSQFRHSRDPRLREETLRRLEQVIENYERSDGVAQSDLEEEKRRSIVHERALRLLDSRARSREELRQCLLTPSAKDPEPHPALVEEVLEGLERTGLVNDAVFASEWVRQRAEQRGKSRRALDLELRRKGVDAETREDALSQVDDEREQEVARTFARKKAATIKHLPADRREKDGALRRVVGVLARRGYPEGMSFVLARQAVEERYAEIKETEAES